MAVKCEKCGNMMADRSQFCGYCGSKITKKNYIIPIILIVIVVLIAGVFLSFEIMDMLSEGETESSVERNKDTSKNNSEQKLEKSEAVEIGIRQISKAYGAYVGTANVRMMLENDDINENPYANVNVSNIFIEENYLYCDFYIDTDTEEGVLYEYLELTFDKNNSTINANDMFTEEGVVYNMIFDGRVYEDADGLKHISGYYYVQIYDMYDEEYAVDFFFDYSATMTEGYEDNESSPITSDNIIPIQEELTDGQLSEFISGVQWYNLYYIYADGTTEEMSTNTVTFDIDTMTGVDTYEKSFDFVWSIEKGEIYFDYISNEEQDDDLYQMDYSYDGTHGYFYLYDGRGGEGSAWVYVTD